MNICRCFCSSLPLDQVYGCWDVECMTSMLPRPRSKKSMPASRHPSRPHDSLVLVGNGRMFYRDQHRRFNRNYYSKIPDRAERSGLECLLVRCREIYQALLDMTAAVKSWVYCNIPAACSCGVVPGDSSVYSARDAVCCFKDVSSSNCDRE